MRTWQHRADPPRLRLQDELQFPIEHSRAMAPHNAAAPAGNWMIALAQRQQLQLALRFLDRRRIPALACASLAKHAVYAVIALSSRVMSPRGSFLSMGLAIICFQTFSQAGISAVFTASLAARKKTLSPWIATTSISCGGPFKSPLPRTPSTATAALAPAGFVIGNSAYLAKAESWMA